MIKRSFTLVELVSVIVIVGVLGGMTLPLISKSFTRYLYYSRQLALLEQVRFLDKSLTTIVEGSVPHSIRYHDYPAKGDCLLLSPIRKVVAFNTQDVSADNTNLNGYVSDTTTYTTGTDEFFVTKAVPQIESDPYQIYYATSESRKTISSLTGSNPTNVAVQDPFEAGMFTADAWNRGFVTSKPIALVCDSSTNQLKLYYDIDGYTESSGDPSIDENNMAVLSHDVEYCELKYNQVPEQIIDSYIEVFIRLSRAGSSSPMILTKIKVKNVS